MSSDRSSIDSPSTEPSSEPLSSQEPSQAPPPNAGEAERSHINSSRLVGLQASIASLSQRLKPYAWLWPPVAFSAGVASFFLVDRQQWLGGALALAMLLAWLLLLSESLIQRWLSNRGYPHLSRGVTTFIAQMIHQETLFFSLPFLLATTVWSSGQAVFTVLFVGLALLSILDPLYFRLAERHRWVYFAFHALCVFVVVLVTLPIMLYLTTGESLAIALAVMVVFTVPSLVNLLRPKRASSWLAMIGLALLLAGAGWASRGWVPPANLWLSGYALSPGLEVSSRSPSGQMALTSEAVASRGLFVFTAIRAPRGLSETVYHEWRHNGILIDRIPLEIRGGRAQGYRAWTHKQNFPENPDGAWRVDVMTPSGQRIGVVRFTVQEDAKDAQVVNGDIQTPWGLPGLNWRQLIPAKENDAT
ncbi:Protein of unknown function (DUF2914) [Onishia taeanensis]|uniref:DUF2914 family protein n=1 Tax=Onishia taeanensis TaxID=284577 RepID=A0A328XP73_9GAMM|nr:Protein of unknown function (DUF2914) [Halomonas taeanensis]